MNFSAYSIRHPLFAVVLFTLLSVGGWIGFERMKIQQFPDMDFPVVVTTVVMPGAAPAQLENDVAKVLENKINTVSGLKRLFTTVSNGAVTVVGEFRLGKDMQEALDDVRSAVGEVQGKLPPEAQAPIVSKVGTAGFPVESYTISDPKLDLRRLSHFVDNIVVKRLSGVPGVGGVARIGGVNRQIDVDVDPYALRNAGMTLAGLSLALKRDQENAPGGEMALGGGKQPIRVLGALPSVAALRTLDVDLGRQAVPLGTVARVSDTIAAPKTIALLNGKPVVAVEISRSRGASEVAMAARVKETLAQLKREYPSLKIENVYDLAKPIDEDYQASLKMLFEGGLLAVLVVLLFLRNLRATIVAAVALPLSIIPAFAGMYLLGFSLNIISLLALSLVVGILVDDAIVEIENIMRHLQMGKSPYAAAMEAADEIGLAVIATTFTLIAVFLPTAFMAGVVGQFFRQFGWTAAIAIFASLLVARLLTPMMAAYFLRPAKTIKTHESALMRAYLRVADTAISHRWLTLFLVLALFIGSLSLARFLPSDFLPADDFSQTRVEIELPPGATLQETLAVAKATRHALESLPSIERIYSSVGHVQGGMDVSSAHSSPEKAALNVVLKPRGQRPVKTAIEAEMLQRLQTIPGARFKVGLSNGGASGYRVALVGAHWDELKATAYQLMNEIRALPHVASVRSNEGIPREELQIVPKREAMARHGVTTAALAQAVRVATAGDYDALLSKLDLKGEQIPIVVRLSPQYREQTAVLRDLMVMGTRGPVPLGDVADVRFGASPSFIQRYQRERAITIVVESDNHQLGQLIRAVKETPTMKNLLERHQPAGITVAQLGQADSMKQLFSGFVIAMGVGILCIFGVLVLLFHRIFQPLTILMALPLSVGGAFVALLLAGKALSMPSLIGLVMLMGIATKNSILLVDYAIMAEGRGESRRAALLDACRKRARPIIMTSIAMGAGMLPLMLPIGNADNTFRAPMAISVFGGLVTSTLLSLVVIPTFYTFMDDLARCFRRIFRHGAAA